MSIKRLKLAGPFSASAFDPDVCTGEPCGNPFEGPDGFCVAQACQDRVGATPGGHTPRASARTKAGTRLRTVGLNLKIR